MSERLGVEAETDWFNIQPATIASVAAKEIKEHPDNPRRSRKIFSDLLLSTIAWLSYLVPAFTIASG